MNEQPLPMPVPDKEGSSDGPEVVEWSPASGSVFGPQDRQLFLVEEDDTELDPGYRFDKDSLESVFEPKSFEELTDEIFQKQDSTQPGPVLTREEVEESLRQVLEERQATGNEQPLTVEVARLAIRVRTDAGSMWAKAQRRHEAWSARVAPTLPALNADGSVASPATLTVAGLLFVGVFLGLLIISVPWNWAFVVAVAVAFGYGGQAWWRMKLRHAAAEVKRRRDTPKTPPKK